MDERDPAILAMMAQWYYTVMVVRRHCADHPDETIVRGINLSFITHWGLESGVGRNAARLARAYVETGCPHLLAALGKLSPMTEHPVRIP